MAVTRDRPGPYAPGSGILSLIDRHRNKGLPSPVDAAVLERAGVSPSLIPRTLQALQTLDLIGDDGRPTEVFEAIRLAPEAEYKKRLADWLTDAYADALAFVDPATATETDIRDAFRKYVPTGQQDRMVSLFIALFTAAGVMPERVRQIPPRKASNGGIALNKPRFVPKPPPKRRTQTADDGGSGSGQSQFTGLPPALAGLLQSLPANGEGWTQGRRDAFVTTFGTVLDFCFLVREEHQASAAETEED
jgi:hypothetical protein